MSDIWLSKGGNCGTREVVLQTRASSALAKGPMWFSQPLVPNNHAASSSVLRALWSCGVLTYIWQGSHTQEKKSVGFLMFAFVVVLFYLVLFLMDPREERVQNNYLLHLFNYSQTAFSETIACHHNEVVFFCAGMCSPQHSPRVSVSFQCFSLVILSFYIDIHVAIKYLALLY